MPFSLTSLTKKRPAKKRGPLGTVIELVLTVAVAVGIALLVQAFLVKPYKIPSGSMENTLMPGQRILVNRLNTSPGLGDIVVFHPPVTVNYGLGDECAAPHEGPSYGDGGCAKSATSPSTQTFVKRVVGLPGDHLKIVHGYVYRNGKKEVGSYVNLTSCAQNSECDLPKTITVPAGEYYMMGDNRGDSEDSRYWGPEPQKWIIGVAVMTYWPIDRIGFF